MAKIFLSSSNLPSSACERQCILANWLKPFSFEFGDFTAVKSAKIHPHTTTFPKPLSSSPSSHEQHSLERKSARIAAKMASVSSRWRLEVDWKQSWGSRLSSV